jgi:hypothetical protein
MTATAQRAVTLQVITLVRLLRPSGPEIVRVIDKYAPKPELPRFYEWQPGRVRRAA